MITLYGYPRSRSLRVSWLLEESRLDWQYHLVDLMKGEHKSPNYQTLNHQGKIPTLTDNDITLCESSAICFYIAERYVPQWLPKPGTAESALHHQWVSFIVSELEQPLWSMGKHKFALPEQIRLPEMIAVAGWEFKKAAKIAEAWLPNSDYLLGRSPTIADILLAHTLNWAVKFEQKLPTKLEKYRQKLNQRPALMRALNKEQQALDDH